MENKLEEIKESIQDECISQGEIAYLESHKQEVLDSGDIELCQWAGITEEEYNKGELNPDLSYQEDFIGLDIEQDDVGNALCTIRLDNGQELTITEDELLNLRKILNENFDEIQEYFHQIYLRFKEQ